MNYFFHEAARRDLHSAAEYLRQQDRTLTTQFLDAVDDSIERIVESPLTLPTYENGIQYCSVRKFSYVILFRVNNSRIEIVSVKHTSRDEGFWRNRLDSESDNPQE